MNNSTSILLTCLILLSAGLVLRELEYRAQVSGLVPPVTVYVTGEVASPGAVTLPQGSRRLHAVNLCGGLTRSADRGAAELAQLLRDGETVEVPGRSRSQVREPSKPRSTVASKRATLDINAASQDDLQALPGVGPVLAARILEARSQMPEGSFRSLEDLATIRGIKRKTLARLKPHLELEGL